MNNLIMIPKRKVKLSKNNMSLKEFYDKRNKILITRDGGGIGDILMLRMILEDFKLLMPDVNITIATTANYHRILDDHPFLDSVVNSRDVNENEYMVSYNVTSACIRYEVKMAPLSDMHRSDIWAAHCGVKLTKHNMHLKIPKNLKEHGVKLFAQFGIEKRPIVAFSPISSTPSKDLDLFQINEIVNGVKNLGFDIFVLHKENIKNINCPVISGISPIHWLSVIDQSDYVISVDTGTFHAANGLNKPTVAIFSWADGYIYGKYHEKCEMVQRHRKDGNWNCGPCYNWQNCSKCPSHHMLRKPCITEITGNEVLEAFKRLIAKFN